MTVLALDTTRRGDATLVLTGDGGALLEAASVDGPLDTGVPPLLARMTPPGLTAVVVVTGPGSYTGVRAGMALALGLATARGLPLHGVDLLTAVAAAGPRAAAVVAAADAGRGGVYVRGFDCSGSVPRPTTELRRETWEALRGTPGVVTPAAGDGVEATTVTTTAVLAAAVPLALASPPLAAAGLAAVPAPARG